MSTLGTLPNLTIDPVLKGLSIVFPRSARLSIRVLSSLPSLLVVPFVVLTKGLARQMGFVHLLRIKLTVFTLDNVLCLLTDRV